MLAAQIRPRLCPIIRVFVSPTFSEAEFGELQKHTADDAERDVLDVLYRCDSNAIPSVYVLRARTDSPDGQNIGKVEDAAGELHDTEAWLSAQETLWRIVSAAFPATGLKDPFASAALLLRCPGRRRVAD